MSELLYAGKTLTEIAGYTPWVRMALFAPRDKHGRLRREDKGLPEGVEVDDNGYRVVGEGSSKRTTMAQAIKRAWRRHGMTKQQVEEAWARYKEANPDMGRGGSREGRRAADKRQTNGSKKVTYIEVKE